MAQRLAAAPPSDETPQPLASPHPEVDALAEMVVQTRVRAKSTHERWLFNYSAWRARHARTFFKSEIFNHYLPVARRAIERFSVRAAQMLVPSPEFFEVVPYDDTDDAAGKAADNAVRPFMTYLWARRIRAYPLVRRLMRSYGLYGRCVAKPFMFVESSQGSRTDLWPHARDVDPFLFYFFPETAVTLEESILVFEDNLMPWETYQKAVSLGVADPINRDDLTRPVWPEYLTRRLQMAQIQNPVDGTPSTYPEGSGRQQTAAQEQFVALTEVYAREGAGWRRSWLVWNVVGQTPRRVHRGENLLARPPYRMAQARDLPGEAYPTGMMDDLEPTQVIINDSTNLTLEGQAMASGPPAAVDPERVTRRASLRYRPRQTWLVAPDSVKWMEVPDTVTGGLRFLAYMSTLMDSFGAVPALAEGSTTRNLPRAGSALPALMQAAQTDIRDAAMIVEQLVMTPLLADTFALAAMIPPQQVIHIPKMQGFPRSYQIRTGDLRGEFLFTWIGTLQSQDFQIRAQRVMAIVNQLGKFGPQIMADLELRGKRINWLLLLQRLWRDAAGERGADTIVEDIPPQEMVVRQMSRLMESIAVAQVQEARRGKQREGLGIGDLPDPVEAVRRAVPGGQEGVGG